MIIASAEHRWSASTVDQDKHTIGHPTCHSRLLAKCLLASISTDLSMTIINRISAKFRNDGTYILWALTNNIYRNNVAFVESIREKIINTTLAQHNNDVEKNLIYIKNHLRMITSKTASLKIHQGLITYILRQLKQTSNQIFLQYIQDLHVSYQEGKLPEYDPMKLILDVEDKIRVLQHAKVWTQVTPQVSPAMALTVAPTLTDRLRDFLANHITTEIKRLSSGNRTPGKDSGRDGKFRGRPQSQEWLYVPPANLADTNTVQNRVYHWCTRCHQGTGQWVINHTDATHRDDYKHPNQKKDATKCTGTSKSANTVRFQDHQLTSDARAKDGQELLPSAQLSLQDGINNYFRFDVQDLDED
jgi:hypothetical protein